MCQRRRGVFSRGDTSLAEARVRPLGEKATVRMPSLCLPCSCQTRGHAVRLQERTEPSTKPAPSILPSGEKVNAVTRALIGGSSSGALPTAVGHKKNFADAWPPEAKVRPSGFAARE